MYLDSGQTIDLSEKISDQKNGVVVVVSRYDSGVGAADYGWQTLYIPKTVVALKPNSGWAFPLVNASGTIFGNKYFSVGDDKMTGNDINIGNNNKQWVFRYVVGV